MRLIGADDWAWRDRGPTQRAIAQFGIKSCDLRRLAGGAGRTWTDGRLVIKPVGCVAEHDWVCSVYAGWASDEVRVLQPVRPKADDGSWSVDGWGAHVFVPGRDAHPETELEVIGEVSDRFHAAVVSIPRPVFMDSRDDPWAYGDRLAWEGAQPLGDVSTLEVIDRLLAVLGPVATAPQLVHGDILPNVLLDDDRVPTVIDWPPYYRPVAFARAVMLTDAITFRGAPVSLLTRWATGPDWAQILVRALLYRLGPTGIFALHRRLMGSLVNHVRLVRPVVDAVLAMV